MSSAPFPILFPLSHTEGRFQVPPFLVAPDDDDDPYPCVGYCQVGPEGYCLGCGRPEDEPTAVIPRPSAEKSVPGPTPAPAEPSA